MDVGRSRRGGAVGAARGARCTLAVSQGAVAPDEALTVFFDVTNTGQVVADEVVQLYIHQRHGTSARPPFMPRCRSTRAD